MVISNSNFPSRSHPACGRVPEGVEVFVKIAPPKASETQFSNFLRTILAELNTPDWHCEKRKQKTFAFLRFLHAADGELFLARYGQGGSAVRGPYESSTTRSNIMYFGIPLFCSCSKKSIEPLALRSLQMESKAGVARSKSAAPSASGARPESHGTVLEITSLSCGMWVYRASGTAFPILLQAAM
jgi:hypothetical protein